MKDFKAVIKNRDFKYLWTSQMLSQVSINLMNYLFIIRLFDLTQSTIATSLLWISYALPALLIGPFAAASVDFIERRKLLMATNFFQALSILIFVVFHTDKPYLAFVFVFIYSFLNQFYVPSESASLPTVVEKENLAQANSLFFLTQQSALIVGFGIAGFLNQAIGFGNSLLICSLALFVAFLSVTFLPMMNPRKETETNFEDKMRSFFNSIFDGYDFIRMNRKVLAPFLLLLGMFASVAIVTVNVPVIAVDIMHVSANSVGLYLVVPAGVGALIAALTVPRMVKQKVRKIKIIQNGLLIITFMLFALTFGVALLHYPFNIILSVICTISIGYSYVSIVIPSQTFLQEFTPLEFRGRVFGNFWFFVTIASVIPVIFSGALSEIFGIQTLLFTLTGIAFATLIFTKKKGYEFLLNGKNNVKK